jgi:hypothetical protein
LLAVCCGAGQRFEVRAVNSDTSAELPASSVPGIHTTLEGIRHQQFHIAVEVAPSTGSSILPNIAVICSGHVPGSREEQPS